MKLLPKDSTFFSDIPDPLRKAYSRVSLCDLRHWDSKADRLWIAVDETLEPAQVLAEIEKKKIHHLLQKNKERFHGDVSAAGKLAEDPEAYFEAQYKVFSEPSLGETRVSFAGPEHKDEMKERSMEFIGRLRSSAVSQSAESIIEELYMNAVMDAPRAAGKAGIPGKKQESTIYLAYSRLSLQISCSDPFGSLDTRKFLARMSEVYRDGAGKAMNLSIGDGAGIGCVILFENCTSLILGVRSGQITKVTCVIPLGVSSRQRTQMRKSLHWFEI